MSNESNKPNCLACDRGFDDPSREFAMADHGDRKKGDQMHKKLLPYFEIEFPVEPQNQRKHEKWKYSDERLVLNRRFSSKDQYKR